MSETRKIAAILVADVVLTYKHLIMRPTGADHRYG